MMESKNENLEAKTMLKYQKNDKKFWRYQIVLQTCDRYFHLFAETKDEQHLWMHTFIWIIEQSNFKLRVYLREFAMNKEKKILKKEEEAKNKENKDSKKKLKTINEIDNGSPSERSVRFKPFKAAKKSNADLPYDDSEFKKLESKKERHDTKTDRPNSKNNSPYQNLRSQIDKSFTDAVNVNNLNKSGSKESITSRGDIFQQT